MRRLRTHLRTAVRRRVADIDYSLGAPLTWRDGAIVVWAGMRGVVTLAAAQTLPADTPSRSLLVFIAFLVAVGSLLIQGGTLPWLVRRLLPAREPGDASAEARELRGVLRAAAMAELQASADPALRSVAERMRTAWQVSNEEGAGVDGEDGSAADAPTADAAANAPAVPPAAHVPRVDPEQVRQLRLRMIRAERDALLDARDEGRFSAAALSTALEDLDAEQISIELKGSELE